jgi:hypothetical protein
VLGSPIRASAADTRFKYQSKTARQNVAIQAQVIPLYELDKAGAFRDDEPKGKEFAAERIAAAVSELRDMIIDAWRTSADASVGYHASRCVMLKPASRSR